MPVSMALIGEEFDGDQRRKGIAALMGFMFLGGTTATALGGLLSSFGSWRLVYFSYGAAELLVFIILFLLLKNKQDGTSRAGIAEVLKTAIRQPSIFVLLGIIFLTGLGIFGSFPFSGKLVETTMNLDIVNTGFLLSLFGIGGLVGSRLAPFLRKNIGAGICLAAALLGGLALFSLPLEQSVILVIPALFAAGMAYLFLHSTMVATAQERFPMMKGMIMSLVSFSIFVGGSVGQLLFTHVPIQIVFIAAALVFLLAGGAGFLVVRGKSLEPEKKLNGGGNSRTGKGN
jgi:predicted MFS family arabinose efflux permease